VDSGPAPPTTPIGPTRAAIAAAFGESEADVLLRTAFERTYLDPDGGHALVRRELNMSRSSFHRHLQRARDRLVTTW